MVTKAELKGVVANFIESREALIAIRQEQYEALFLSVKNALELLPLEEVKAELSVLNDDEKLEVKACLRRMGSFLHAEILFTQRDIVKRSFKYFDIEGDDRELREIDLTERSFSLY